mmetsp:Transcript_5057/g.12448  ORF Transcript_5057/g.12448 Transcript_5057/m.12448 type:complete len:223 (+) Transcript_5057:976-1644(+)
MVQPHEEMRRGGVEHGAHDLGHGCIKLVEVAEQVQQCVLSGVVNLCQVHSPRTAWWEVSEQHVGDCGLLERQGVPESRMPIGIQRRRSGNAAAAEILHGLHIPLCNCFPKMARHHLRLATGRRGVVGSPMSLHASTEILHRNVHRHQSGASVGICEQSLNPPADEVKIVGCICMGLRCKSFNLLQHPVEQSVQGRGHRLGSRHQVQIDARLESAVQTHDTLP